MRVAVAIQHFDRPSGAATYALITARHLARLGHEAFIHTPDSGQMGELAVAAGLEVSSGAGAAPDVVLAQDMMVSFELADRWRGVPQAFVAHGAYRDEAMPPQLAGTVSLTIVLNDRVGGRVRALAAPPSLLRLRQPIDTELFRPRAGPAAVPQRAILFGNHLKGHARERVVAALGRAGVEAAQIGWYGENDPHPERRLAEADLVIGYGRCALEGMAMGRPTYVLDHRGGDGWVTGDAYPLLEANGFAGTATDASLDVDGLAADFRRYDPHLGSVGRKLVMRYHDAFHHATALADALRDIADPAPLEPDAAAELARLSRAQWESEWRAGVLLDEVTDLHERLRVLEAQRRARRGHDLVVAPRARARRAMAWMRLRVSRETPPS